MAISKGEDRYVIASGQPATPDLEAILICARLFGWAGSCDHALCSRFLPFISQPIAVQNMSLPIRNIASLVARPALCAPRRRVRRYEMANGQVGPAGRGNQNRDPY